MQTPLTSIQNLIILLLIKLIYIWQQPKLIFIKYDVHTTCLVVYFPFFLIDSSEEWKFSSLDMSKFLAMTNSWSFYQYWTSIIYLYCICYKLVIVTVRLLRPSCYFLFLIVSCFVYVCWLYCCWWQSFVGFHINKEFEFDLLVIFLC